MKALMVLCQERTLLAIQFIKEAWHLMPVAKSVVPSWDLIVVLEAMCKPPFVRSLESLDLRMLS